MEPIGAPHFRGGGGFRNGELIALTGRQKGLRRALCTPLTFVGRAAVCDVRLNLPGIDPFHCLFVHVPTGLMVRDLNSSTGTFINGERISQVTVHDGDTLGVGALQFQIRLPPNDDDPQPPQQARQVDSPATETTATTDALRIQAAAVAAQHMAVTEEEIRLTQRQAALHEQEQQLSARFEEERRQLETLRAEVHAERDALYADRAEYEGFVTLVATCLDDAKRQLVESHQDIQAERRRLAQVELRIKKRNRAILAKQMNQLAWREEQLANETCNMEKASADLARRTEKLEAERLHFTTEYELSRRRLAECWRMLRLSQGRWAKRRRRERAALNVHARDVDHKLHELAAQAQGLHADRKAWQAQKQLLQAELAALEARVVSQRTNLRLDAAPPALSPSTAIVPVADSPILSPSLPQLLQFASSLCDQRRELVEHWQILALNHHSWHQEAGQAAAALEALGRRLLSQEAHLADRQRTIELHEGAMLRRREDVVRLEEQTAADRARLRAQEIAWESERTRLLADVQHREDLVRQQTLAVTQSLEGWNRRRTEELNQLHADRAAFVRLHKEYLALIGEWRTRLKEEPGTEKLREQVRNDLGLLQRAFQEFEHHLTTLWDARLSTPDEHVARQREQLEFSLRELTLQNELQRAETRRLQIQEESAQARAQLEELANLMLRGSADAPETREKAA